MCIDILWHNSVLFELIRKNTYTGNTVRSTVNVKAQPNNILHWNGSETTVTVTDLIVTCYCVTYTIVTSNQYLFVFLLYPCELSVLFFIRCKIRVLVACQVHEKIDLKDRYDY